MCGKPRFILFCASAFILCGFVSAQAESLSESVVFALKHHPSIDGAQASLNAAEQSKSVEKANYFPELSVDAAGGRTYQDNSTSRGLISTRGAAYSGYGEANIALRQMMFDGLETTHRVRAAQARIKSRDYSLLDVEEQITLRTAESYIEILRLRAALTLLDKHTENIKDYEARITDMVIEGVSDEADRQQARDVSMVMESLRADYEGQIMSARAAFAEAVGSLPPSEMVMPTSLQSYINEDTATVIENAKAIHPLLQVARMDSQAARHDMKATNAGFYPDVSGELSYSKLDKKDVIGGESKDARALVRMSWDISLGGKQFAAMRQKRFEHYEARAKSEELEREIERDIYQSYAAYRTYKRKYQLAKDRVDLNKKLLDAYKTQFEGARINLLQLMKAESQSFNALLEESDNGYYLISSEYGVLASVGELRSTLFSVDEILSEKEQGK
ncbi:MAG: TolC family protein [Alphaproteobacteria bacterium]